MEMPNSIIIEHATVVTMNQSRAILKDAAIVICGDRIAAVDLTPQVASPLGDVERIDGSGRVVLPGLINAHTHIALSVLRGLSLAVPDGLYRVIWPLERQLTPEDCYVAALAGGAEALKAGTTTVVDRYFFEEQAARAAVKLGLRGFMGHTIMSDKGPRFGQIEFDEALAFIERWHGRYPTITPNLAPHAPDTVDRDWLIRLRRIADEVGAGLQLHLAQTEREQREIAQRYGMGCVEYLDDIGFLGPDVLAAHCIFVSDSEIDILARSGAHPVYCPMGHALGGRVAAAWEMLTRGASVLIGTDCTTANNVMDLVGELRIAGVSQKQLTNDPCSMPATKLLEMVTVDAAEALGVGDRLGAIIPDHLADLVVLRFDGLHTSPNNSLIDNIVYCCTGRDVEHVIVNGELVVRDGRLVRFKEDILASEVAEVGRDLLQRAGVSGLDPNSWTQERS